MRLLLVLLAALLPGTVVAADIKLLTAGAYKPVALDLIPEFEKRTGHKVTVENATAGQLQKRVADGEYFDVLVLPPLSMAPLMGNRVVESSGKVLARVGIGVGVKAGTTPLPDISDVDAFRKTLLVAKSVAYVDPASGGSSGIYVAHLFDKLGIAAQMKPKSVLVSGGLVAERLLDGQADLALHQKSEIMAVPGVTLVGPIPLDVQH
ncbi:MAG: substrate-binding domain-containing protein [Reyranella sp.]|nr:substrate-binding domain-containing protein [Reyranella sp.]